MANYTGIITYTLYDFNDKSGRVPFLDNSTFRTNLAAQIRINCGLSDS
jgi:hypothetical protein|tara:strand:- start:1590 stop:1733 length:144 start_codon:yes stop_codon:yes gene_type:complete